MRTDLEKDLDAWRAKPFSFTPSKELYRSFAKMRVQWAAGSRKRTESKACMCQNCGSVIVVGKARNYRGSIHPEVYCDKECAEADRSRVYRMRRTGDKTILSKGLMPRSMASKVVFCSCQHCEKRFAAAQPRQFCSTECTQGYRDGLKKANRLRLAIERIERQKKNAKLQSCKQCGIPFTSLREGGTLYCSQRCVGKYARKNRDHIARSSRKIGGGFSDVYVFKAAKWECKICGLKVHQATGQHSETQATIDHIVPMSRGGLHVWGNVQCACQRCNASKSDKIDRPVQMTFL